MIKVALIGVSGFGDIHYNDILRQIGKGKVKLVAATIINQAEEKGKCEKLLSLGCKIFTDYREMLSQTRGIDLCVIPTGIHLHAPMSIDAMRSNCNVLVEKPVAATVQDVEAMKKCEKKTSQFVAVGYQWFYSDGIQKLKEILCLGKLGKIRCLKYYANSSRNNIYYQRNNWAGKLKCGAYWVLDSPYNNAMAHHLNNLCFLAGSDMGKSAEINSVEAELYRAHNIESVDTACMRIKTEHGPTILFYVTHCSEDYAGALEIHAEKGMAKWDKDGAVIEFNSGKKENFKNEAGIALRDKMYRQVFKKIRGENAFICDIAIAGTQTICVNGAHNSSSIQTIDHKYVKIEKNNGSVKTVVKGIEQIISNAFEKEKLFSEMNVLWAKKGKRIDMRDYHFFNDSKGGTEDLKRDYTTLRKLKEE